jgi:3-oxoacyl-[acyl-carrier protein] reductase
MIDIHGKTAFITGSSRGIGQQFALGLAQKGCHIILHGRTEDNLTESAQMLNPFPITVHKIAGELSTQKGVQDIITQVSDLKIPVDILINNAGIMLDYQHDYSQHTWEAWIETYKVNVIALYDLCCAFLPQMIARNFGRIVNLSSGIMNTPELAPYGASKWAVRKITEELAFKVKDTGVRINSLDPGWLKTDMGGEHAPNEVTAVLPGALDAILIPDDGPNGQLFNALN